MASHVVSLVPALLETLSVIEDPALNYLQMHSESAGVEQGALESARVAAMRGTDATSAIDTCLRLMDETKVEATLPAVMLLLTRGVGLPTRAGTARFIVQLAQQHPLLIVPQCAALSFQLPSPTPPSLRPAVPTLPTYTLPSSMLPTRDAMRCPSVAPSPTLSRPR